MALPTDPASREESLARRRAAEEEALLREVDDAVRKDDVANFGQQYGRMLAIGEKKKKKKKKKKKTLR